MSPLPSPEERRKALKIPGLQPVSRRPGPGAPLHGFKSAHAAERAEQRKEGRLRSKQAPPVKG
ncbi:MAG TPA: hypothetical protein VFZ25_07465 [Chloroflexota bacterium]|nr:hypothetical protein [Chloroflexota bacterium]